MNQPLSVGTRIHHIACLWSYGFTPEEQRERPSWGWATIVAIHGGPYSDGGYEYIVRKDAPTIPGHDKLESQWGSHHIDQIGGSA